MLGQAWGPQWSELGHPGDHCHRVTTIVPLNLHSESDLQACPSQILSSASAWLFWGGAGHWSQHVL